MARSRTVRAARAVCVALTLIVVGGVPLVSMADRSNRGAGSFAALRYGPGVINHPVGVVPSSATGIPLLDGSRGANLRDFGDEVTSAGDFCTKCHVGEGVNSAKSMHWVAVGVAHVKSDANSSRGRSTLDSASRRCMSCHDGVNASDSPYSAPGGRGSYDHGDARRNHPVGVQYANRRSRTSSVRMKPSGSLPKEIRLAGGTVGCTSCHNLYSQERYKLAVPIEGSRLCLTCHDMD